MQPYTMQPYNSADDLKIDFHGLVKISAGGLSLKSSDGFTLCLPASFLNGDAPLPVVRVYTSDQRHSRYVAQRRGSRYHPYSSSGRDSYRYDCYTCWERFPTMAGMWRHKRATHKKTYYCRICSVACPSLISVKNHQRVCGYPCQHCAESFRDKESLTAHISEAHENTTSQPPANNRAVGRSSYFKEPIASSTPDRPFDQDQEAEDQTEDKFKCARCIKTFDSADKLECHSRIHTDEKSSDSQEGQTSRGNVNLSCPFCIKRFRNKRQLSLHMSSAHTATYYCAKCTAEFESQAELNIHTRNHATLA